MKRIQVRFFIFLLFLVIILFSIGCNSPTEKTNKIQEKSQEIVKENISSTVLQKENNSLSDAEITKTDTEKFAVLDTDTSAFDISKESDDSGWKQTAGPLGGTVIRMILHGGTVWASLYSGGIYELQKDTSWKQIAVGHGIPEVRAFDIVPDTNDVNTVYVPETILCGAKTINNGMSWNSFCSNLLKSINSPNFNTNTLALDPANSKIVYLPGNTFDGTSMLLVSDDGGEQWKKRFTFDKHYEFNHLFFFNSKMYLTTVEDGILVSSDKGKSWIPFNKGLEEQTATNFVSFKNNLYLLTALRRHNVRMGGSLYHLSTDGTSWEKISELMQVTGLGADDTTLFVGTWSPDPKLWVSTDGDSFQEKKSSGLPPDWVGEIVRFNSKIYVGAGGNGVYVSSDNGESFQEFNKGMISVATREVQVNPQDENEIYVGTWDRLGFYWSKNGGKGYERLAEEKYVLSLAVDPQNFSHVFLGGDSFGVGIVSREGSTFVLKEKPGKEGTFVKSIAVDPSNANHVLVGIANQVAETPPGEGLFASQDGGATWKRSEGISNFAVYSIIFNSIDPKIVYASALGEGVFKSTDGGNHFISVGTEKLKYTYRLAMSSSDPNILVASSNLFFGQLSNEDQYSGKYGGIFQTKDGGVTWKELTKGIRNYDGGDNEQNFLPWLYNFGHMPNYEMILIDPKNADHLVVGHHGENVVETTDGGATWKKAGAKEMVPGGVHNYAYCLGASSSFKKFYACTCGRGLFQGISNDKGYISLSLTGDAVFQDEDKDDTSQVHNVKEAKEFILSGQYNHEH